MGARKRPRRNHAGSSNEPIQSNIVVKQSEGSSENVDAKIGNQNKGREQYNDEAKKEKPNNRSRFRSSKYDNYTELNNSMENFYLATQNTELYRKPAPMESTEKERKSCKFFIFHETHNHSTNECMHLGNMIEDLIRKKKLQQYMKAPQDGK